jgi:hypothetical protein
MALRGIKFTQTANKEEREGMGERGEKKGKTRT